MSIDQLIGGRRTIALFKPEVPPRELIQHALDLARWAPNHRLTEPWRFYLLGPSTTNRIIELNAELVDVKKGAAASAAKRRQWSRVPGWLLVTCMHSEDPVRRQEDYASCACAIQNLALWLWHQGIGLKWTTGEVTRDPRFFELLSIDFATEFVVGLLWYGYPEEIPVGRRKPLDDVLFERP